MNNFSLDSFWGADGFMKGLELGNLMQKEIFSPQDLEITYTNINYWDKAGILSSQREGKHQWRNFNFIDYIWIKVIEEMRAMGISIKIIKKVKNLVFQPLSNQDTKYYFDEIKNTQDEIKKLLPISEQEKEEFIKTLLKAEHKPSERKVLTYFYLSLMEVTTKKTPVSLLVFKDGNCFLWVESQYEHYSKEHLEWKSFETHIAISLSNLIKKFLLDEKSVFLLPQLKLIEPNEIRLLELIHSGNYDTINISFKDRKIKSVELKKTQDTKRKIIDILTDGAYQDIVIKSHKGMVTHIQNTVKLIMD